jgi:hypothetical protein
MEDKIKQKKLYLFYLTFNSLPLSIFPQTKNPTDVGVGGDINTNYHLTIIEKLNRHTILITTQQLLT